MRSLAAMIVGQTSRLPRSLQASRLEAATPAGTASGTLAGETPAPLHLRRWIALWGAMLGAFMAVLDIQITNSSLPDILGSLGATLDEGSWISTSYLVAEIIVIPLTAWLADVFGTRRYLLANTLLFLAFSVACAFAWNLGSMIAFRVLQGFTGGVLIPMAFTLVLKLLPPGERPFGYGLFGMTATFAPAIGPTVGGWLTDNYGWPAIFYLNLIPGVLMLAAIGWGLHEENRGCCCCGGAIGGASARWPWASARSSCSSRKATATTGSIRTPSRRSA